MENFPIIYHRLVKCAGLPDEIPLHNWEELSHELNWLLSIVCIIDHIHSRYSDTSICHPSNIKMLCEHSVLFVGVMIPVFNIHQMYSYFTSRSVPHKSKRTLNIHIPILRYSGWEIAPRTAAYSHFASHEFIMRIAQLTKRRTESSTLNSRQKSCRSCLRIVYSGRKRETTRIVGNMFSFSMSNDLNTCERILECRKSTTWSSYGIEYSSM